MFCFLALIHKVSWKECFACGAADFLGAFVGACLVALFYAPHFGFSLPLPSDTNHAATLLEGPVSMEKDAGRIASAFGPASKKMAGETMGGELRHFLSPPTDETFLDGRKPHLEDAEMKSLLAKMKVRHQRRSPAVPTREVYLNKMLKSTRSVQVAAMLHAHDPHVVAPPTSTEFFRNSRNTVQIGGLMHRYDAAIGSDEINGYASQKQEEGHEVAGPAVEFAVSEELSFDDNVDIEHEDVLEHERLHEAAEAAYRAALQADQSAKLSIFATRPAIFNRPYNFLQEMLLSAALFLGAELFNLRAEVQEELTGAAPSDGPFFKSFYVAMYIAMLILGVGGVTGLAANPARDLGPRLAHHLLPLPGKGGSEWEYGLVVPLWGPLAGSALAAVIYKGIEALFDMAEEEDVTGATGAEL